MRTNITRTSCEDDVKVGGGRKHDAMTTRNAEAGAVVLLSAGLVGLLALGVGCERKEGPTKTGETVPAPGEAKGS